MEENGGTPEAPTVSEVLRGLAEQLLGQEGTLERMTVQRATDQEYPAKLHLVGQEDYVAASYRAE